MQYRLLMSLIITVIMFFGSASAQTPIWIYIIALADSSPSGTQDMVIQKLPLSGAATPEIVSTSPTQNELNVAADANISVTFDTDMDGGTIQAQSFLVYGKSTGYHSGSISYDNPSRTATINPDNDFIPGELVTVMLSGDITSTGAVPLENYYWSFTVAVDGGRGEFKADSTYSAGGGARSIVTADLDGDGFLDLAVSNPGDDNVSILLNNGNGTFASQLTYSTAGDWPLSITAADVDYDGYIDLAAANWVTSNVAVMLNTGTGAFAVDSLYTVDTDPVFITAAELDDVIPAIDLVTSNAVGLDLSVLLNQGEGDYSAHDDYPADNMPYSIAVADFDGDGDFDLAAANAMSDNVSLFLNNGDGTFGPQTKLSVGERPMSITAADLDRDGDVDLVTANEYSDDVSILYNSGGGNFAPHTELPAGEEPYSVCAADVDDNGYLDIIAANNLHDSVSILLNSGVGFVPYKTYNVGYVPICVVAADLDNDGDVDLATANRDDNNVTVLLNYINEVSVTSLDDASDGSLRWAIDSAANDPIPNDITFAVSGTINLVTPLPPIDVGGPTRILGSTAPGKAGSVVLDGSSLGAGYGLSITSSGNVIEGLTITNFPDFGIAIYNSGSDSNVIINNTVSYNDLVGICSFIGAKFNRIGGYDASEQNVIIGNGSFGILISSSDSNMIIGNQVGGTISSPDQGNANNGIQIEASYNNFVDSNIIGYNTGSGVTVFGSSCQHNTITRNAIYNNDGLGIDLGNNGVTANDPGDGDTGPNDLLNFPEIDSLFMNPDSTFTIYGRAASSAVIEFFVAHPATDTIVLADPSGHGEAYSYHGADTCDVSGGFIYETGEYIEYLSLLTATATDASGNTSEFCENVTLIPGPLIIVAYWTESPVNMMITDPEGFYIGKDSLAVLQQTLFPADYTENVANDSVYIPYPKQGSYTVEVYGEKTKKGMVLAFDPKAASYDLGIRIDGSFETVIANDAVAPPSGAPPADYSYDVEEGYHYLNGDADRSEGINLLDATFIINYLYKEGPEPYPIWAADANCDLSINILDVTYIINYLYKNGPMPCQTAE